MLINEPPYGADAKNQSAEYEPPIIMSVGSVRDVTRGSFPSWAETAAVASATTAVVPYVQAIMSELGKRTVEVAPKAYRGISCRFKFRGKGSKALVKVAEIKVHLGVESTTVVLTKELPDEARLMLLDLDLTSEEFRGRILQWDDAAGEWTAIRIRPQRRWHQREN